MTRWPGNGVAVEHGPLVYSLPIEPEWSSKVEPRWSTADFPVWIAHPTSAWNYGIVADPSTLAAQVKFRRGAMSEDPWTNPPTAILLAANRVEGWELVNDLRIRSGFSVRRFRCSNRNTPHLLCLRAIFFPHNWSRNHLALRSAPSRLLWFPTAALTYA